MKVFKKEIKIDEATFVKIVIVSAVVIASVRAAGYLIRSIKM